MNARILLIITLLSPTLLFGQLGQKGGIQFTNLRFDAYETVDIKVQPAKPMYMGFHGGIARRFAFASGVKYTFLQPEVLFVLNRSAYLYTDKLNAIPETEFVLSSIQGDIPLLFGYKTNFLQFTAGPVINARLFGVAAPQGSEYATFYDFNSQFTFSIQLGAGFDFENLKLDLAYQRSLSKYTQTIKSLYGQDPIVFKAAQNSIILSLSFFK